LLETVENFKSAPHVVRFSPDGTRLCFISQDGIELRNAAPLTSCELLPVLPRNSQVAWSPDGRTLAFIWGGLAFVDVQSGRVRTVRESAIAGGGHIAFSREGLLAACSGDTIQLWHVPNAQVRATLRGHAAPVVSLAFDPTGTRLASIDKDGILKLRDLSSP